MPAARLTAGWRLFVVPKLTRKFLFGLVAALAAIAATAALVTGNGFLRASHAPANADWRLSASNPSAPQDSGHSAPSKALPETGLQAPSDTNNAPGISAAQLLQLPGLQNGHAETRLIEIFSLLERSQFQQALAKSGELTRDHPNFQLAHLVHGDLLKLRFQPSAALGDVSPQQEQAASVQLAALRAESQKRLDALRHRPPPGTVPHQFVSLSPGSKHAIAIDASRSRLYLFENKTSASSGKHELTLVADFFISVGKSGIRKQWEGDGKTPLGVYYITSVKERKSLPAFYGAGALPINYPNAFDVHQGRTGSGIWLHGTPPDQYVRAPLASDGCVVLSNPDMQHLLDMVAPRTTPVVIAEQLQWVAPDVLTTDKKAFEEVLSAWQSARSALEPADFVQRFLPVSPATATGTGNAKDSAPNMRRVSISRGNAADWMVRSDLRLGLTQLSLLQSHTPEKGMVATFEDTVDGQPTGVVRRQYWLHNDNQWRLLQDTVLSGTPLTQWKRQPPPAADTPPRPPTTATLTTTASPVTTAKSGPDKGKSAPAAANGEDEAVRQAVAAWAKAWSQKNMAAYLQAYDSSFPPPGGQRRKEWEQERRERILSKSRISVSLSQVAVQVKGQTATVRFSQSYQADTLKVSSRKTLKMVKRGKNWLIAQELVGNH